MVHDYTRTYMHRHTDIYTHMFICFAYRLYHSNSLAWVQVIMSRTNLPIFQEFLCHSLPRRCWTKLPNISRSHLPQIYKEMVLEQNGLVNILRDLLFLSGVLAGLSSHKFTSFNLFVNLNSFDQQFAAIQTGGRLHCFSLGHWKC